MRWLPAYLNRWTTSQPEARPGLRVVRTCCASCTNEMHQPSCRAVDTRPCTDPDCPVQRLGPHYLALHVPYGKVVNTTPPPTGHRCQPLDPPPNAVNWMWTCPECNTSWHAHRLGDPRILPPHPQWEWRKGRPWEPQHKHPGTAHCPVRYCRATPGAPCRDLLGNVLGYSHPERDKAANPTEHEQHEHIPVPEVDKAHAMMHATPPSQPDWYKRANRMYHALVLRHVQGDTTWTTGTTVVTTCECGKKWRVGPHANDPKPEPVFKPTGLPPVGPDDPLLLPTTPQAQDNLQPEGQAHTRAKCIACCAIGLAVGVALGRTRG